MGLALAKERNYSLSLNTSIYADLNSSAKIWIDIGKNLKKPCKMSVIYLELTNVTEGNNETRY